MLLIKSAGWTGAKDVALSGVAGLELFVCAVPDESLVEKMEIRPPSHSVSTDDSISA